ncbi:hypothetical protein O181_014629 [Austropuccinia psidii MF-1]|uniref:Uncharacterized protein n=1 Tax=Austropuccinia psidii MF-1 TaxID=1389203 RepID=A0A9Q3BYH0_9BASI|nr:hypothetical protein [Austropuccinia psidii MF-1]
MDWVTGLPPGGDRSYNSCLVIVDRFNKTAIFFPCYNDYKAMDSSLLIWNRVVYWNGIFTKIINQRDPKLTPALWKKPSPNMWSKFIILYSLPPTNSWSSLKDDSNFGRHGKKILCIWPKIQ